MLSGSKQEEGDYFLSAPPGQTINQGTTPKVSILLKGGGLAKKGGETLPVRDLRALGTLVNKKERFNLEDKSLRSQVDESSDLTQSKAYLLGTTSVAGTLIMPAPALDSLKQSKIAATFATPKPMLLCRGGLLGDGL
jgi:hypothetical protein